MRWTLVAWYGVLLGTVVAVFGAILYGRVESAVLAGVDGALEARAHAVMSLVDWDEDDGWEVDAPEEHLRALALDGWFQLVDTDGVEICRGGSVPAFSAELAHGFSTRGTERELVFDGWHGTSVRVGRSIESEKAAQRALSVVMFGSGVSLLAAALAGGWWLTTRALRPIENMSSTARRLSEHDLSARVDGAGAPVELRGLADTLNDTFERLQKAFARQARFTADASHELRTPLSVVRAQAELALRRERDGHEYRTALEACLRAAERMGGTVQGLLALARADAGERAVEFADVEFAAIVREALDDARPAAESAHVAVELDLQSVIVRGDAALLGEVVTNLVINAIRYNRAGGHVRVRVRRLEHAAELKVEDNGLGIPAEALPHVFERFYRVDPARSRERGGSGLGLAITRWIVTVHGGTIGVESGVGQGSTFTVRLPVVTNVE